MGRGREEGNEEKINEKSVPKSTFFLGSPRALNKAAPSCLAAPGIANPSAPHSDIDGKLSSLVDRESTCQHLDGAFIFWKGHIHVAQFDVVSYCGSGLSAHPGKGSLRSHNACP